MNKASDLTRNKNSCRYESQPDGSNVTMKAQEERQRVYKPNFVCLPRKQQDWDETRALHNTKERGRRVSRKGHRTNRPSTEFISGMDATALSSPGCVKVVLTSCQSKALVTRGLRESAMRCEPSLGQRVAKRPGQSYAVTDVSDCMVAR
jgi:hypothetical protein